MRLLFYFFLPICYITIAFNFLLLPTAQGQTTDATITGLVKDKDGGALPGVTVMVRNASTGFKK